ncbi:MAG: ABC transporter permease [Treponema sp.]|jgi:lipoprotein-releasing system permease protein|nr:ABC transporter permease [Treponema sp.]
MAFVAARHNSRRKQGASGGASPAPVLAILGIGVGVLALTVIIAVMNGFQLGFIESIIEISSFHVRAEIPAIVDGGAAGADAGADVDPVFIETDEQNALMDVVAEQIRTVPGVVSASPFRELYVILHGKRSGQEGALIRGVAPTILDQDAGMAEKLDIERGSFDLTEPRSIVLGAELANRLHVRVGDTVEIASLSGLFDAGEDSVFTVTGIFRSGFYEYDIGWGFVNINTAALLDDTSLMLGVKLKNRWNDARALQLVNNLSAVKNAASGAGCAVVNITSWRDYNKAFFSALRSEKLLMFLLVGLIFIVVGLNIFQAQRRAVLERREEIGLLRALGADEWAVRLIFVWDGFVIGLIGAGVGTVLGLFLATHISGFFTALEHIVNAFISLLNLIYGLFGRSQVEEFAIFSPAIFYIKEIPARVIPRDAVLIFLFGFLSALAASWFASRRAARTRPAEVLRYE